MVTELRLATFVYRRITKVRAGTGTMEAAVCVYRALLLLCVVMGTSAAAGPEGQQVQGGKVIRIGVLTPDASDRTSREVRCENLTGQALTLAIQSAEADFNKIFDMKHKIRSLLQLTMDFMLINASIAQKPLVTQLGSSQAPMDNVSLIISKALPKSDMEWCCAFCCSINITDEDLERHATLTLGNDSMKIEFLDSILRSLGWKSTFIIYDDDNEELVQALTSHMADTGAETLYRLAKTSSSGNDSAIQRAIADTLVSTDTINGIITCSLRCILEILKLTLSLESEFKRRVSVIMSTNWLLVPTRIEPGDAWVLRKIFALGFDNIGVMVNPAMLPYPYQMPEEFSCSAMTVSTLLWKANNRRELSPVGHYCKYKGPEIMSDIFPNTRFGFNGRHFIVSTMVWDPYIMKEDVNGTVRFYGMCADLLEELARTLNFTYSWTQPPDMMWGHNNNGTWSGLVGQLNRQEVDLTMAPLAMSKEREEAMDFTFPFFHDFSGVLLKRPDPNATKWRTYIDIFRWQVLMCLGLTLLGGSIVCITIEAGERSIFGRANLWIAVNRFWVVLGALLSQGSRQLPRRGSGRIFLSSWWVFSIVLAATYSGNLIAFLTVTKDKSPFDTLLDMVNQDEYTYGTIDQSMWTMLFEFSNSSTYQAIHRNMQEFSKKDPRVLHPDPYVHLEMVREGGYAYIADTGLFSSWLATNCDLMLIKEKFYPSKYAVGLPNNSAYTKLLSDQIMKIYESGLLQVWVKRWWPKRNFCGGSLSTEAKVLNLMDVQSVFYVAGVGIGLPSIAMLTEFLMVTAYPSLRHRRRDSVMAVNSGDGVNEGFAIS